VNPNLITLPVGFETFTKLAKLPNTNPINAKLLEKLASSRLPAGRVNFYFWRFNDDSVSRILLPT
jgi:hypothetical protein